MKETILSCWYTVTIICEILNLSEMNNIVIYNSLKLYKIALRLALGL